MVTMSTKPVSLRYRGWVIQCTPEQIAGGWCAVVEVQRHSQRNLVETVPFTLVSEDGDDACVEGLIAAKRWIDARLSPRPCR